MMVTKRRTPNIAIELTKKDLTKLNEAARDFLGTNADLTFRLTCSDAVRTFDKIAQVQEFENATKKEIKRLIISGSSEDRRKSIDIGLGTIFFEEPVSIEISGRDVSESALENTISTMEEVCDGMKPWYSIVATFSILKTASFLGFGVTIAILGLLLVKGRDLKDLAQTPVSFGSVFISVVVYFTILSALHSIRRTFFPLATFAIGQGERRAKNAEIIRIGIVVTFVVGIASGVVVGVFL